MLKLVLYIRISLQCNNDIVSHAIAKGLEVMFPQETLGENAQFKELASIYLCQKRFKMFFFCIIIIILYLHACYVRRLEACSERTL